MSEIKVNKITPRVACGTTVLGDSGDTISIPAGVSITNSGTASGFGATGAASWNTTVKTTDFTAVAGEGYFVNTTAGVINVTLPAGSAGDVIAIKDYAGTFATYVCTLIRNGSDKVGGSAINPTLSTNGIAATIVYVDAVQGWLVTDDGLQSSVPTPEYIVASGGTPTTDGDYKVHTFTGPGTFCVSAVGNPAGSATIDYLVVAGGGAGGYANGGGAGGGAGGLRYSASTYCNPTPCGGGAASSLPVAVAGYPVQVGGGGPGVSGSPDYKQGTPGSNSVFTGTTTITSAGGGGGGGGCTPPTCASPPNGAAGVNGGSGGGGGKTDNPGGGVATTAGVGNTPPVSPAQGRDGGTGGVPNPNIGGGGGGHSTDGQPGCGGSPGSRPNDAGDGGNGSVVAINGTCAAYAGGGGGNAEGQPAPAQGSGGSGGGGAGVQTGSSGNAGSINTGGGGGGIDSVPAGQTSGAGGSGIVIIRYKFQN